MGDAIEARGLISRATEKCHRHRSGAEMWCALKKERRTIFKEESFFGVF